MKIVPFSPPSPGPVLLISTPPPSGPGRLGEYRLGGTEGIIPKDKMDRIIRFRETRT